MTHTKVKFTVEYETIISLPDLPDESDIVAYNEARKKHLDALSDAIADIDIPEGNRCKYKADSFEVLDTEEVDKNTCCAFDIELALAEGNWKCPKCGEVIEVDYDSLAEAGTPMCIDCDCQMAPTDEPAT